MAFMQLVDQVPKDVDPRTFVLSDKPANGQTRALSDVINLQIQSLGLKYLLAPRVCLLGADGCQTRRPSVP
jgi:hypothetical protein